MNLSWINELIELYDKNSSQIGEFVTKKNTKSNKDDVDQIKYVLLPIFHTTVLAQITITIDHNGEFISAERIQDKNDRVTIIPVTESSGSRTSSLAAHPLCDTLKYVAGDYMTYYIKKKDKENFHENFQLYIKALQNWYESKFCHPKVKAIYQYLKKETVIKDLISSGVIILDENNKMAVNEKILSINQMDAFVRFNIYGEEILNVTNFMDKNSSLITECWKDKTLQENFISYYITQIEDVGMSYISGQDEKLTSLHPKKIRNEGDGSKLFSSNDAVNFTYRGFRFEKSSDAYQVGYVDSQKMHNALKWILRKQGYSWGDFSVVIWESDLNILPEIPSSTYAISTSFNEQFSDDEVDEVENLEDLTNRTQVTGEAKANDFQMAMKGHKMLLKPGSKTVLLAFDAATQGRLALIENKIFESSNYLESIQYWHESCEWKHMQITKQGVFEYKGMASVGMILDALYGNDQDGKFIVNDRTKTYARVYKRLIPCITEKQHLPYDFVQRAMERASAPLHFSNRANWGHVLSVACSFIKKYRFEKLKEEWNVALDKDCTDRNYLYGRLLAIADQIEFVTFEKEDRNGKRETNAQRLMMRFSQRPFETWKIIYERTQRYQKKLISRKKYIDIINEIYDKFNMDDFQNNASLNGLYLLGFHSQLIDLKTNKKEETSNDKVEG